MSSNPAVAADAPWTMERAQPLVSHVESLFHPWNVDAIVEGFTPDCVVRFCDLEEFSGHEELRKFFLARSKRQKDYRLKKTLKAAVGDVICNTWRGTWQDAASGQQMVGFGCEVWTMRDGRIAVWDAAFNASPTGQPGAQVAVT